MHGGEFKPTPTETPKPVVSARPKRNRFATQCREDLTELRNLVGFGRRREAIELLRRLPMWHFVYVGQRREMAELCAELGYAALAGRWWYLEEHKTPEMLAACHEFELACGENPLLICESLGDWIDAPPNSFAERRFAELQSQAEAVRQRYIAKLNDLTVAQRLKKRIFELGCFSIFVAMSVIFLVGLSAIALFLFEIAK